MIVETLFPASLVASSAECAFITTKRQRLSVVNLEGCFLSCLGGVWCEGMKHCRGILLFGPPGTGKTLMARQIGKMLNAREPKIVNGPQVLDKYVGESEANIRKLFAEAEEEEKRVRHWLCFMSILILVHAYTLCLLLFMFGFIFGKKNWSEFLRVTVFSLSFV